MIGMGIPMAQSRMPFMSAYPESTMGSDGIV
jgi:hypothetical protein